MLILLPPSEGKTAPAAGAPVDLGLLVYPELTAKRERALAALVHTSSGKQRGRALKALGLSAGQAGELDRNAGARGRPGRAGGRGLHGRALRAAAAPRSPPAAARERVLISSALWGVVRPDDRIPAYRLSISARLPRVAGGAAYWRPALAKALPDEGLVIDLRSGGYAAAWAPKRATVVGVRGFTRARRRAQGHQPPRQGDPRRRGSRAAAGSRAARPRPRTSPRSRRPPAIASSWTSSSVDVIAAA